MRALVLIETTVGKVIEVSTALKQLDEVKSADVVTGPYDVIAVIEAEDLTAIGHIVTAKIKAISGVSRAIACTTRNK